MKGRFSEAPPLLRLSGLEDRLPECNLLYSASRVSAAMVKLWLDTKEKEDEVRSRARQWYEDECQRKRTKVDWESFAQQEVGLAVQSFERYLKQ